MILQETKRNVEIEGGNLQTHKMVLGQGIESHIIKILTEYSYKDGLGSGIREGVSNAVDSHIESGQTLPILVSFKQNAQNQWELSIEDFGLGLDDVNFYRYIMGVGESTKRHRPDLIGGMGAGAKAWLSYTDSYQYICRKDGIERKFLVFKGETVAESALLYEKPTEENNGVKVIVVINNSDYSRTLRVIKEQCSYFEGVWFDVPTIDQTYEIIKYPDFQWNTLNRFSEMHIALKGVYYPIDWNKIGISRLPVPVALRFDDYDGIKPVFNREEIQWDKDSIETVTKKIKQVADFFVQEYNKVTVQFDNIVAGWSSLTTNYKSVILQDTTFTINSLVKLSDVPMTSISIKGLNHPEFFTRKVDLLEKFFTSVGWINSYNNWSSKHVYFYLSNALINSNSPILVSESPVGNFKQYLKEKYANKYVCTRRKMSPLSLGRFLFKNRLEFASIDIDSKTLMREFVVVLDQITAHSFSDERDGQTSPQYLTWLGEYREKKKKNRAQRGYDSKSLNKQIGDVTIHKAYKTNFNKISFAASAWDIQSLYKEPCIFLYGTPEDKEELKSWYKAFRSTPSVRVCFIGPREFKKVENHPKFIPFKKMQDLKPFKRICSAVLFAEELEKHQNIFKHTDILKNCLPNLHKDVEKLEEYVDANLGNRREYDEVPYTEMVKVAHELNLFDKILWTEYMNLKKFNEELFFITAFQRPLSWNVEAVQKYRRLINQMLIFRKLYYEEYKDATLVFPEKVEEEETNEVEA